jgi:hypothetical protein
MREKSILSNLNPVYRDFPFRLLIICTMITDVTFAVTSGGIVLFLNNISMGAGINNIFIP